MSLADFIGTFGSALAPSLATNPDTVGTPGFNPNAPSPWTISENAGPMAIPGMDASNPIPAPMPQRKGGGLRDLLGNLGDALIVGSGGDPIYAPKRQQERIGDAVAAFLGSDRLSDIARLDHKLAIALRDKDADYQGKALENDRSAQEAAMQYLGGAHDQMSYDRARAAIASLYGRYGLNVANLGLPATYSPQAITELRLRGTSTKDQLGDDRLNRRLAWDVEDDQIDNARMDRNTDSLIDTREGRLSEYQRNNQERARVQQRGQDLTDQRARSGRGGRRGGSNEPEGIPVVSTPEEARRLPSGTRFRIKGTNAIKVVP